MKFELSVNLDTDTHLYYINLFNLKMNNLKEDLRSTHTNILDWLNQYEKISEETIKQNYTSQFHQLLDYLSSSDYNKLK